MEGNMFITLIRRTSVFLALGLIVAASVAARVEASACSSLPSSVLASTYPAPTIPIEARSTDPVGPFPLSTLVPFPWTTIQGIWATKVPNGTSNYFSFEVQADCSGQRFVRVLAFDQKSYRVTAEGVGVGTPNDTIVRAVMNSGGSQQMIYIRQFRVPVGKTSKISTVITIRPFDGSKDQHMIARHASPLRLEDYVEQQREVEKHQADIRRRFVPSRP
jgi:hypothetical protein